MSQLIPNEIPSGVVDGVNKVFTFINDIDYITQLTLDGAEYVDFTVDSTNKKQITLVDAPIVSIYADYYPFTTTSTEETECTFWDIKQKVWSLTGQTSNSTNFSDTIVSQEINLRGREIWKGRVVSKLIQDKIYRAGDTSYRESFTNIRMKWGSALSSNLELWDIVAEMNTSFLLPSWYVEIGGDIIKYTSVTDTQLEWVSGQQVEHFSWEKVIQLYEMPENFEKPKHIYLLAQWQFTRKKEITYDESEQFTVGYKIIKTNWKTLLKISWIDNGSLQNNDLIRVEYTKKYQQMTQNSDICPFGEDYWIRVLAYIVAGSLGYDKSLINAQQHLNSWYSALTEMYWDYNDSIDVVTQNIIPKSYNFTSIRRF